MEQNTVVTSPEDAGFAWSIEAVAKQAGDNASDKVEVGMCPIPVMADVAKFRAAFGDTLILSMADGQGLRIPAQRIGREALAKDRKVTVDTLKVAVVQWMFGQRNARRPQAAETWFVGMDGEKYKTLVESQQSNLAYLVDKGIPVAQAKQIIGIE